MSHIDIIRAWKDEAYRNSLSAEELALLPANPAGAIELNDVELDAIRGGNVDANPMTMGGGCDYSYDQRPSCGYLCTATTECWRICHPREIEVSVQ